LATCYQHTVGDVRAATAHNNSYSPGVLGADTVSWLLQAWPAVCTVADVLCSFCSMKQGCGTLIPSAWYADAVAVTRNIVLSNTA
jgi:hypothetical protein